MRPGLHNLAQSAAADKQVPGWDNVNGIWAPRNTVHSIVGGPTLTVDNTDPFNPVLASVSATGGKDRRWNVGPGETSIDEFNDASLDAAWGRVDVAGGTSRATWTEGADTLSVFNNGGDTGNELHAMVRTLTSAGGAMVAGDAFITASILLGPTVTNYTMGSLILADGNTYGAGAQVLPLSFINTTVGAQNNDLRKFTNYNLDGAGSVGAMGWGLGALLYSRLVMLAANTWRLDLSPDGVTWRKGTATLAYTMTPTYVGFYSTSYGTATKGVASFEFLRRVSGIT